MSVLDGGFEGLGEAAPIGYGLAQSATSAQTELQSISADLENLKPWQIAKVEEAAAGICSSARCALVNACYDWIGKSLSIPVYRLLGLDAVQARTSITVGINTPEMVRELTQQLIRETGTDELKLKLGNPDGIEADKESFLAAKDSAPAGTKLRVDANGGWSVGDALDMIAWLASQGCGYVEQPLGFGDEAGLAEIAKHRRIPIFLDEFICTSGDVACYANVCDGINMKLMKSGGVAEGIRCVHVARAHGLRTMIGCFGESSVSIAAGAAIGCLFDYIDLDSHLNLEPDPAEGCTLSDGRLVPCETPGFGVRLL